MQYRIDKKSGNKLSILGFGCMRFSRNLSQIDMIKTELNVYYQSRHNFNKSEHKKRGLNEQDSTEI